MAGMAFAEMPSAELAVAELATPGAAQAVNQTEENGLTHSVNWSDYRLPEQAALAPYRGTVKRR
jgi:hypothetical protein